MAGLVCCLLGFLLVWMSKGLSRGLRAGCGLIAGLSFASAFGLSTWVAVAFAMMMAAWMVWAIVWERGLRSRVPFLLLAGVVASAALLPYLAELHGEASATNAVLANGSALSCLLYTSLLGHRKVRIHAPGHLPRDGVLHVEEAREFAGVRERSGHAQLVHLQHLRLHFNAAVRGPGVDDVVAADDDEVRVQRLRNADGGGAAGAKVRRQPQICLLYTSRCV